MLGWNKGLLSAARNSCTAYIYAIETEMTADGASPEEVGVDFRG